MVRDDSMTDGQGTSVAGLRLRPEDPGGVEGVRVLLEAAFPTAQEANLVEELRKDPAWIPGLSWVATAPDAGVAGQALLTRCHIGEVAALCLAPCAVLPAWQGLEVGSDWPRTWSRWRKTRQGG